MENEAVFIPRENAVGIILQKNAGWAIVRYTDIIGIEHEEVLFEEEYQMLEEWETD